MQIGALNYSNKKRSGYTDLDLREELINLGRCLNGGTEGEERAKIEFQVSGLNNLVMVAP